MSTQTVIPTLPLTPTPALPEAFAGGNPNLPLPWQPFTEQDFLNLVLTILPASYTAPMVNEVGPGWEIFQQYGATFQRMAQAIASTWNGLYALTATGGQLSTVVVAFSRPSPVYGPVTVLAGAVVATAGGLTYVTQESASFGATDVGPINVQCLATFPSAQFNCLGPYQTAGGELVPGPIDSITYPLYDPPYGDPTITVSQVTDATGGQTADLDALAQDRGLIRNQNETDAQLRTRLRTFKDQVSPIGLQAAVNQFLSPYGVKARYVEPFNPALFGVWNGPTSPVGTYVPAAFCWNAPGGTEDEPLLNRWLPQNAGFFVFVVPNLTSIAMYGGAWNDPEQSVDERLDKLGGRAAFAWNAPVPTQPPSLTGAQGTPLAYAAWNGQDVAKNGVYQGLYQLIQKIKAAGILFDVWLEGQ